MDLQFALNAQSDRRQAHEGKRIWFRTRKDCYTIKAFPQTVPKEFKGLAHAELVLMFPERFREEVMQVMRE